MDAAMYKALSGAVLQMRRLEMTAQDLANVNTSGYKGQRLAFGEVLARRLPAEDRPGGFVAVAGDRTQFGQGALEDTGNPFNLAIEGDGYFAVQTARGERYTRNGSFTMRADGTVITPLGETLLTEGGPLQLTGNNMEVGPDGTVRSDNAEIGRLRIVRFNDAKRAAKEGSNVFVTDPANVIDAENIRVVQGTLEQSNVSPIDSMVSLIQINRNFEAYERAMKLMDSMTEKIVSDSAR